MRITDLMQPLLERSKMNKHSSVATFALFGGKPVFTETRSTSNLYRPNLNRFLQYTESIFEHRYLTNNGPLVQQLEKRLAELHGTHFCIAFCSGFMALQLAMHILALPGKTEIIMPSATYRRMADIAAWAGLTPCFTDVSRESMGMTGELTRPHITKRTALILGVHPIVNISAIEELEKLSTETGIPLLIDAVEAAYGTLHGKKIGSFGKAEVFSIHASKFINGFEGGYITTSDEELAERLRVVRAFGFVQKDTIKELGTNAKLNEVHAAIALACLDEIDQQIQHNKAIFEAYETGLNYTGLRLLSYDKTELRTWKNIVVELTPQWPCSREVTLAVLNAENILARPYYTPPLHRKIAYYAASNSPELSNTDAITAKLMLLPSGAHVSVDDVYEITSCLKKISEQHEYISNSYGTKDTK